jgi:hypothetical protein
MTDRIHYGNETDNEPWYLAPTADGSCPDCGVAEGELHKRGCDREQCPECGQQLIGCRHGGKPFT